VRSDDQANDHDAFGWIDQGRRSDACRHVSAQVVRACWPYILVGLLMLATMGKRMNSSDAFMLTAGGRDYVLATPWALMENPPNIGDIAHHLALINRFTGATSRPYSVAEHSLLVERIGERRGAAPGLRMALLMHDAHEAYTTDLSSPAKSVIGLPWAGFEAHHASNVRAHFGLRTAFAAYRREIDACDLIALATERRDLMAYDAAVNRPWPVLDAPGAEVPPDEERLDPAEPPLNWRQLRAAFVDRYHQLAKLVQQVAP
jgi:hypothetical protein